MFPPIPSWDKIHPLVVHFPIALLMVAPIFVILAIAWKSQTKSLLAAVSLMVVLGTIGAFVATASGEAAEELAERVPGAESIIHEHQELAETARNLFTVLAVILVVATIVYIKRESRIPRKAVIIGGIVYVVLHCSAAVVLANAAHEGGRLVHEVGVEAWANGMKDKPATTDRSRHERRDDDD